MRIIAGSVGGRRLRVPKGREVRPTPDRVREALFASLGPHLGGATVLDLYAGSGALGLEALSRGAARATFVESSRHAIAAIGDNVTALEMEDRADVVAGEVAAFCSAPRGGPFDLVCCDPPYAVPMATCLGHLDALEAAGALSETLIAIIERERRDPDLDAEPPQWLAVTDRRTYGDVALVRLERAAPEGAQP